MIPSPSCVCFPIFWGGSQGGRSGTPLCLRRRRPEGHDLLRSRHSELSWVVWDVEDSLEFYPAQASQSFFSLPRSLQPRNRLGRSGVGP
ncbi:hypothetical protein Taro_007337 [Colocasia esculenta]|uniref:Uncharacterized protein n=1 Tax=Colocasia esculenta TaxID=4460 RepID=A0A843TZZ9_COLES|nr:hypothetical protein [Colocasia esculenta]